MASQEAVPLNVVRQKWTTEEIEPHKDQSRPYKKSVQYTPHTLNNLNNIPDFIYKTKKA